LLVASQHPLYQFLHEQNSFGIPPLTKITYGVGKGKSFLNFAITILCGIITREFYA